MTWHTAEQLRDAVDSAYGWMARRAAERKARRAKHIYRKGDTVVIVEPQVFDRCGYPLSFQSAFDHVSPLVHDDMVALFSRGEACAIPRLVEDAIAAIARGYMRAQNFGGRDRTIHTHVDEVLRGRKGTVLSKRMVKTGQYRAGSSSWEDGEQPSLRNVRTHVILEVSVCTSEGGAEIFPWDSTLIEIEECHVKPVEQFEQK